MSKHKFCKVSFVFNEDNVNIITVLKIVVCGSIVNVTILGARCVQML